MSWAAAYRLFSSAIAPFTDGILSRRIKAGKEDAERTGERKGFASLPRPSGKLVWMHGASVGETSMLLPLIEKLLGDDPALHVLVTSGTMTSAQIMAERLPARAFHQMVPIDVPNFVTRFLNHWKPDLAVWAESEIWPNLVTQTKESGARLALINARMSRKSLDRWQSKRNFAQSVFGCFDLVLPADDLTYRALANLSDKVTREIANLKTAMPEAEYDANEVSRLKTAIGNRPVWLAASTHTPEEADILTAHNMLRQTRPDALLLWIPRHPERGNEIASSLTGHELAQRSLDETPDETTSIYLMDTLGEMGLALALADIDFVGGSLHASLMGHNPLEPARAGVAILTGPHISSFAQIYDRFFDADAAMCVSSAPHLAKTLNALLDDIAARRQMAARAKSVAQEDDGILDFTARHLQALI